MLNKIKQVKNRPTIVNILDIGSSRVLCVIAQISNLGEIKILGVGHHISNGLKSGIITDLKLAEDSILLAIEDAEQQSGTVVHELYLVISSHKMAQKKINISSSIKNSLVTERDLIYAYKQCFNNLEKQNLQVVFYQPLGYELDNNNEEIRNPLGLYGKKLITKLIAVTVPSSLISNLNFCLNNCDLNISEIFPASIASAYSCLSKEEMKNGATIIDLGLSTTSYASFINNRLISSGNISLGGQNITSDIARILEINLPTAERIKTLYGSCYDSYYSYDVIELEPEEEFLDNNEEAPEITRKELNEIVYARLEEIFMLLKKQMHSHNIDKTVFNRIVLTGGASEMEAIEELASKIFLAKVKTVKPIMFEGLDTTTLLHSSYAAVVGVLDLLIQKQHKKNLSLFIPPIHKYNFFSSIFRWIKEKITIHH